MNEKNFGKPPSVEERLSYLGGQLLALNIAVGSLLKTHPNPAAATRMMESECEDAMSHILPSMLDDAFMEGMSLVKNRFIYGDAGES